MHDRFPVALGTIGTAGAFAGVSIFMCAALGIEPDVGGMQIIVMNSALGGFIGFIVSIARRKP